tara:strand:+ start:5299 stop:5559 length:261 start_codon:yes stop_codon:yes gene_type:complete
MYATIIMDDLKVLATCLNRELSFAAFWPSAFVIRYETLAQVLYTLCYRVEEGFGHGSPFVMYLLWAIMGKKSRGLNQFVNWHMPSV